MFRGVIICVLVVVVVVFPWFDPDSKLSFTNLGVSEFSEWIEQYDKENKSNLW